MAFIAGIDPGGTTGFAVVNEDVLELVEACQIDYEDYCALLDLLNKYSPRVIVVEAFRPYPNRLQSLAWDKLPAPQVIGAVKAWCAGRGARVVEQPAAVRKSITPAVLRAIGMGKRLRGKPHAKDAVRHVLWYLSRQYPERFAEVAVRVANG